MASASAANGKLSVVPNADSYFYETFTCQAASSDGYNAITFHVKGPVGASFTLEMQTKSACSVSTYQSYFHQISGLTGVSQTIRVPLSAFTGANVNAVTSGCLEWFLCSVYDLGIRPGAIHMQRWLWLWLHIPSGKYQRHFSTRFSVDRDQ